VTEFSAARAQKALASVLGDEAPHPPGTAAHDTVRDAISRNLGQLGFEVEPLTSFVCGTKICTSVTNLLARLPGRVGANAVLLTAHYDSVPAGPGASDDGVGVATLLESARALKASAATRRPIWLLLTDGEELGLFGAKAFAKSKALLDAVGVVVNVEARGTSGPSLMFETSAKNGGLVRIFAKSTEHPVASSIFPTIYSLLPNDTDFSVFRRAGIPGLNYAVIGDVARYHTPRDDLAHADTRSLQHQGDNVLAVVRALADGRDSAVAASDLVFFDLLGIAVVRWPTALGPWMVLGLLAVHLLSTLLAMKKGLVTLGEHGLGLLGILAIPAATLLVGGSAFGFRLLGAAPAAWVAHPTPWIASACGLGAAAAAAVTRGVARGSGTLGLLWGATTTMIGAGAALSLTLPGLEFLFLVPAIAGCLGCLGFTLRTQGGPERKSVLSLFLLPASAVLVWVPLLGMVYDALGTGLLPGIAAGTGLLVWTASPLVAELHARTRGRLLSAVATGSLVAAAAALTVTRFTDDLPAHASLRAYVAEGEEPRTTLSVYDVAPDALTSLFPRRDAPWPWASERAPAAPLTLRSPIATPTLEVMSDTHEGSVRHVLARLRSSRSAAIVGLALPDALRPTLIRVQGEPLASEGATGAAPPAWRWFECATTPAEGLEVDLTLEGSGPGAVYVYDRTPGLPDGDAQKLEAARPSTVVPFQNGDVTVAARRVEL